MLFIALEGPLDAFPTENGRPGQSVEIRLSWQAHADQPEPRVGGERARRCLAMKSSQPRDGKLQGRSFRPHSPA